MTTIQFTLKEIIFIKFRLVEMEEFELAAKFRDWEHDLIRKQREQTSNIVVTPASIITLKDI